MDLEKTNYAIRMMATQKTLTLLSEQNIPNILLKGMDLAHRVYPHPEQRKMSDVDVLVRESSFLNAQEILLSNGYLKTGEEWNGRLRREFIEPKTRVVIDLHGELNPGHRYRFDSEIWERAVLSRNKTWIINSKGVKILGAEDCLCYLFIHAGLQHALEQDEWFDDIYYFLKTEGDGLNWGLILSFIKKFQIKTISWLLLLHANDQIKSPTVQNIISELTEGIPRWKQTGLKSLFLKQSQNGNPRSWFRHLLIRFLLLDNYKEVLRYFFSRKKIKQQPLKVF